MMVYQHPGAAAHMRESDIPEINAAIRYHQGQIVKLEELRLLIEEKRDKDA